MNNRFIIVNITLSRNRNNALEQFINRSIDRSISIIFINDLSTIKMQLTDNKCVCLCVYE